MALALYRTYRPGTLADVVGQEHVTEALARALDADRTHHAYLFSGPRGCGKTSTARILARSLNCAVGPTSTPCGSCRSCLDLAPNGPGSIDVVELDAATHRGIDDARELREKAIYAPAASRYRVYIIDEAHQLTPEASNALLKLVEEPPEHLRFIFATTEPDKIIATIRSRTFHYPFRLVPARVVTEHLAHICAAEGVPAEPAALSVVARAGAGSVRDSLSVLGQLLAGAGPSGLTHADAVAALGITDDALIDGFVAALSAGSVAQMLTVVDGVISAGHDPRRFVSDVLDRLRDLIVLHADPGALESGLIDLPDEAGERLRAQSQLLGLAELSHAADQVSAGLSDVKGATAPRLQLELLCARLALHHPGVTPAAVLARLDRLERDAAAAAGQLPRRGPDGSRSGDALVAGQVPGGADPAPGPQSGPGFDDESTQDPGQPGGEGPAAASASARPAGAAAGGAGRPPAAPPRRPTLSSPRGRQGTSLTPTAPDPGGTAHTPPRQSPDSARDTGAAPGTDPVPLDSASNATDSDSGSARAAPPVAAPVARAQVPPTSPAPPGASMPGAGEGQARLGLVTAAWPTVLDALAQGSRVAWTAFAAARPLSVSNGVLAVAVPDAGAAAAITQRGHDLRLREALLAVLQLDVTIDVVHDAGAATNRAPGGGSAPGTAGGRAAPRPAPSPGGARAGLGSGAAAAAADPPPATARGTAPDQQAPSPDQQAPSPVPESGPRGAAMLAGAGAQPGHPDVETDEPSEDDPDVDDEDGLALVTRELGARTITEIDHD